MASVPCGIMRVVETSLVDLLAGQVAADAGLGALADLDLDGGAAVQVVGVDAEPARGAPAR